ncbi:MAG: hypothetical protein Q4A79_02495, partial [Candidatus Saccharibacteria bacterium]|nr:hypothetical protein [Candidatus Saccharibacteria bacterium]
VGEGRVNGITSVGAGANGVASNGTFAQAFSNGAGFNGMTPARGSVGAFSSGVGFNGAVPSGRSRGKRGLLIILIIALAMGVGVLIFVVLRMNFGGKTIASAEESFNRFANYVISGEESTMPIEGEFDLGESYYFMSEQINKEAQATIYKKTGELLEGAVSSFNKVKEEGSVALSLLQSELLSMNQMLELMEIVYLKEEISGKKIIDEYVEKGRAGAIQALDNYYDYRGIKDNPYVNDFKATYEKWVDLRVSYEDVFSQYGCFKNGVQDLICLKNNGGEKIASGAQDSLEEAWKLYEKLNYYYNLDTNFVLGVYRVNDLIATVNQKGNEE